MSPAHTPHRPPSRGDGRASRRTSAQEPGGRSQELKSQQLGFAEGQQWGRYPLPARKDHMDIEGRNALVTGGGSGIGAAIARALDAAGAAHVVVTDLDEAAAKSVAADLRGSGHRLDVSDQAATNELVAAVEREVGPIDLVFLNAGIAVGGSFDASDAEWEMAWQGQRDGSRLHGEGRRAAHARSGRGLHRDDGIGRGIAHQHRCRPVLGDEARRRCLRRVACSHLRPAWAPCLMPVPAVRRHPDARRLRRRLEPARGVGTWHCGDTRARRRSCGDRGDRHRTVPHPARTRRCWSTSATRPRTTTDGSAACRSSSRRWCLGT